VDKKTVSAVLAIWAVLAAVIGVSSMATPAHAASGHHRTVTPCVTSAQWGLCFPANGAQTYQDENNVWNAGEAPGWSQTMTATKDTQFSIDANVTASDGQSVISYPEVNYNFTAPKPLSQYGSIVGQWHAGLPNPNPGDRYEMAYDLWLDAGPGQAGSKEVMVWTQNDGQYPGGTDIGTWTDPRFGNQYEVWENSTTVWFVCKVGSHTGSVDIKSALQYAILTNAPWSGDQGNVFSFDYGPEIVTTTGHLETFYVYGVNYIFS